MHRPRKFDPPWVGFFSRPCPWFTKQLTSFPQFSRLPKELQLMIWELAEPCRQVVSLSCLAVRWNTISRRGDPAPEINLQYRRPGMRKSCFNARVASLKYFPFTPAFKSYLPSPIRFNFDRDVLELDMHMMEWIATVHEEQHIPLLEPPLVKNLAVSHYRQFRAEDLILICQYFTSLEYLFINEPEHSDAIKSSGIVLDLSPEQANCIDRYRWRDIAWSIKHAIRGVRPKLHNWKPPKLTTGTVTQWARLALSRTHIKYLPLRSERDPDMMDWSPTLSVPSLAYTPRLDLVSGQFSSISIQRAEAEKVPWDLHQPLHMAIMKCWVFEDTTIRLFGIDPRKIQDIDSLSWPGRDDMTISVADSMYK